MVECETGCQFVRAPARCTVFGCHLGEGFGDFEAIPTIHENAPETVGRLSSSLNGLATDLDTERGGTDANKGDAARQIGRLTIADLQL
jgi:hypothetical protein